MLLLSDQVKSDLRNFNENFHLTPNSDQNRGYGYEKQPSPKLASPSGANQQQARGSPGQKGSSPPTASDAAAGQRRTSPPTASIITRQDSTEQRTPTPAKSPPMATPPAQGGPPQTGAPPSSTPAASAQAPAASIIQKSKLNPNAKEFVLNPKAKEFVPPPRPPVGQTPPPARPITPATPTGMPLVAPGYYPGIPYSQGGVIPFNGPNVAVSGAAYISPYPPTSQPPPPQYQQQPRFRTSAPVTSAREVATNHQLVAGNWQIYFIYICVIQNRRFEIG